MAKPLSPAITLQDEELDRFLESANDEAVAALRQSAERGEIGLSAKPQQPLFQDVVYEVVPNPRGLGNILRYVGPAEGRPWTSAEQPPPPKELDPADLFEFDPRFIAVQQQIEAMSEELQAQGWPLRLTETTPEGFTISYDPAQRLAHEVITKNPTIGESWREVIAQRARRHWDMDRLAFQTVEPYRDAGFRGIVRQALGHAFPRIQAEVAARVRTPEDKELYLRNVAKWVRHLREQSADPNKMSLSSSAVLGAIGGMAEVSEVLSRLSGLLKLEPEEAKLLSQAAAIEEGSDPTSGLNWAVREAARFTSQQAVGAGFAGAMRLRQLGQLLSPIVRLARPVALKAADLAVGRLATIAPGLVGGIASAGEKIATNAAAAWLRNAAVKGSKWLASMNHEANLPALAAYWTAMIWPRTYDQYLQTMDPRSAYWSSFGSAALQSIVELWEPAPLKLFSARYAGKMIQNYLVTTLKEVGEEGVQAFIDYWAQTSGNIASQGRVTTQDLRQLPQHAVESVKQASDAVFYSLAPIALMVGVPAVGGAAVRKLEQSRIRARQMERAKQQVLSNREAMNVIFGALDRENLIDLALSGPSRVSFHRYLGDSPFSGLRLNQADRELVLNHLVDYLLARGWIERTPDGRLARPTAVPTEEPPPPPETPPAPPETPPTPPGTPPTTPETPPETPPPPPETPPTPPGTPPTTPETPPETPPPPPETPPQAPPPPPETTPETPPTDFNLDSAYDPQNNRLDRRLAAPILEKAILQGSLVNVSPTVFLNRYFSGEINPDILRDFSESIEVAANMAARRLITEAETSTPGIEGRISAFRSLVDLYENKMPRIGTLRTSTQKGLQQYSTPVPLAYAMSLLAGVDASKTVLEPTAGHGALLLVADPQKTFAMELDPNRAEVLRDQIGHDQVVVQDATTPDAFPPNSVDVVLANPPFSRPGDNRRYTVGGITFGRLDHAIVWNALTALKENGSAALLVMGPSPVNIQDEQHRRNHYRSESNQHFYRLLYEQFRVTGHATIDGSLYDKMGTRYPVDLIVIHGRGRSSLSHPALSPPPYITSYQQLEEALTDDSRLMAVSRPQPSGLVIPGMSGDLSAQPGTSVAEPILPAGGAVAGPGQAGPATTGDTAGVLPPGDQLPRNEVVGEPSSGEHAGGDTGQTGPREGGENVPPGPLGNLPAAAGGGTPGQQPVAPQPVPAVPTWTPRRRRSLAQPGGMGGGEGTHRGSPVRAPVLRNAPARTGGRKGRPGLQGESRDVVHGQPAGQTGELGGLTPAAEFAKGEIRQVSYEPRSKAPPASPTFVNNPNLEQAFKQALELAVRESGMEVDDYVAAKLNISVPELHRRLDGVQIDALALIFNAFDRGEGFILGDMTGVGKGRVAACAMLHAKLNRRLYIFATENHGLYSDIGRDLHNVGYGDFSAIPTNADLRGQKSIVTPQGKMIRSILPPEGGRGQKENHQTWFKRAIEEAAERYRETGELVIETSEGPQRPHGIFTTYAQLQGTEGDKNDPLPPSRQIELLPPRAAALVKLADQAEVTLVADESHDAAGEDSSRLRNLWMLIHRAKNVLYMSATWAKRPSNIPLYGKTSLRYVYNNMQELVEAFRRGRIALQQVTTWMLANDGVFLARQMDFSQAQVRTMVIPIEQEGAEKVSEYMRRLYILDDRINMLVRAAAGAGRLARISHGQGRINVEHTGIFSLLHNLVGYARNALKLDKLVPEIAKDVRENRKVLCGIARTLESTMKDATAGTGEFIAEGAPTLSELLPGENARTIGDLRLAFLRYLMRLRIITVKTTLGYKKTETRRIYIRPDMFTGQFAETAQLILNEWEKLRAEIARPDNELARIPLYPIDFLRSRLAEQGIECQELTGRRIVFDYEPGKLTGKIRVRPSAEVTAAFRRKVIDRFNGRHDQEPLHVLVGNAAAATGISLHASPETGTDWDRPRMGYILEPLSDVNEFQQFLGRIYRKGQVHGPTYVFVSGTIPSEMRAFGSLSRKLRSLNANTSADTSGLAEIDVPDLFGEVADQVADELLFNNPDLNRMLGNIVDLEKKQKAEEKTAAKMTGRLVIAPLALQETIMQSFIAGIKSRLGGTTGVESSESEAVRLDLDIAPYAYGTMREATGEESVFQGPVFLLLASAKRLEPPLSAEQFLQKLEANVGLDRQYIRPDGWQDTMFHALLAKTGLVRNWLRRVISDLNQLSNQIDSLGGDSKIKSVIVNLEHALVARSILGTEEARRHPVRRADVDRAATMLQQLWELRVRPPQTKDLGRMHQQIEPGEQKTVEALGWLSAHGTEDAIEAGRLAERWMLMLHDTLEQLPPSVRSHAIAQWRLEHAKSLWEPRAERLRQQVEDAANQMIAKLQGSVNEKSPNHEQEAVRAAVNSVRLRSREIVTMLDAYKPGSGVDVYHQFENARFRGIVLDILHPRSAQSRDLIEPGAWKLRIVPFSTAPSMDVSFAIAASDVQIAGLPIINTIADSTPNVLDEPALSVGREPRIVMTGNIPMAYKIATDHLNLTRAAIAEATFAQSGPQYVVLLPRRVSLSQLMKNARLAPRDEEEMIKLIKGGIDSICLDSGVIQFRKMSRSETSPYYRLMVPGAAPTWWNNPEVLQIIKRHGRNQNGFSADSVDRTIMVAGWLKDDQVMDLIRFGLRTDENGLHHSWWVPSTLKEQFTKILGRDAFGWTIVDESKLSVAEREILGLQPAAKNPPEEPPSAPPTEKGSPGTAPTAEPTAEPTAKPTAEPVPTWMELVEMAKEISNAGIFSAKKLSNRAAGRYRLRYHDIQIIKRLGGMFDKLTVLAHEVGHAVHARSLGFQDLTLATGAAAHEFIALGRSIYPEKKKWKDREFAEEGWAELWSLWLMDSETTLRNWPKATEAALTIMAKVAPREMALLVRLRDAIARVRAHGKMGWVRLGVVDPTDPRRGTLSVNSVSLFRAFWPMVRAAYRRLHRAIDNRAPFKWFDESVAKAFPEYFAETDDPVPGLRDFIDAMGNSSANAAVSAILYHGPFSISKVNWGRTYGPNLDDVFAAIRKHGLAMVDWYCACRHSIETWRRGLTSPIDFETAVKAVAEMEEGRPELVTAHQTLTAFNNGLCLAAQDCAVPGFENVQQAISFWSTYVPLYRQREDAAKPGVNAAVPSLDPPPLLRRRHGSLAPILSPTIMTMVRAVWFYDRMMLAQRIQRMVEMVDAAGLAAEADYLESIEKRTPGIPNSGDMGLSRLVSGPLTPSSVKTEVPLVEAVEQLVKLNLVDASLLDALKTQKNLPPLEFWTTIWKRNNRHYIRVNRVLRHSPGRPPFVAKQVREIDPQLYAALLLLHQTGAPQTDSLLWSGILRTMRFFTRMMRLGWIGLNHRFGLNNLLLDYQRFLWKSDQATAYTATLGYFKAVTDLVCGFIEEIAKGKSTSSLIKLFLDTFGITRSALLTPEGGSLPQRMKGLIKQQAKGPFGRLLDLAAHPVRTAEEIISSSDLPARLAAATEEAARQKAGIDPEHPLGRERGPALAALLAARRATTDFAVGGTSIQTASSNFWPLLNAYVTTKYQTVQRVIEATRDPAAHPAFWIYVALQIITASMYAAYRRRHRETVSNQPDWTAAYWLIYDPDTHRVQWMLPRERDLGTLISAVVEQTFDRWADQHADWEQLWRAFVETQMPSASISIFSPIAQVLHNRHWFFGYTIEAESQKKLSKRYRVGPYTSELFKALGPYSEYIGLSPVQLQFLVDQFTGGALDRFLLPLEGKNVERLIPWRPARDPSRATEDWIELVERVTNAYHDAVKRRDQGEGPGPSPDITYAYRELQRANEFISTLRGLVPITADREEHFAMNRFVVGFQLAMMGRPHGEVWINPLSTPLDQLPGPVREATEAFIAGEAAALGRPRKPFAKPEERWDESARRLSAARMLSFLPDARRTIIKVFSTPFWNYGDRTVANPHYLEKEQTRREWAIRALRNVNKQESLREYVFSH